MYDADQVLPGEDISVLWCQHEQDVVRLGVGILDFLEGQQFVGDQSQDEREVSLLSEDADAEPALITEGEAEVRTSLLLDFLLVPVREPA